MVEKEIRHEIHDMSSRIYELQNKQNTLTNGQRYAVVNEVEKSARILRNDLRHLERKLYSQESDDKILQEQIDSLVQQINDLEDIKSDLTARIHTETEHTRQELNNKIIKFMSSELEPIKQNIDENKKEINSLREDFNELRIEIIENDKKRIQSEKERDVKEAERFDKFKMILTAVLAVITGMATLSLWLEPSIRILMNIFF